MMLKQFQKWYTCGFIALVLASCQVMLIGAYDQVTDETIQKIQGEVVGTIVKIEKNIKSDNSDANKYENFRSAYDNIEGEIESLKIRCTALPKYNNVIDQLNSFDNTIQKLEAFHKLGFSKSDTANIKIIRETLELDFKNMITVQNALKREKNNK